MSGGATALCAPLARGFELAVTLGDDASAEYGGRQSLIDNDRMDEIEGAWGLLSGMKADEQQAVYKTLLTLPPQQAGAYMRSLMKERQAQPKGAESTTAKSANENTSEKAPLLV